MVLDQGQRNLRLGPAFFRSGLLAQDRRNRTAAGHEQEELGGEADGQIGSFRRENLMTLARGSIRGYEDDRMVLLFSMMDGAREVPCAVSASAMDYLEHVPRTPAGQREEQFTRLRDRIEACASRKFLAREFEGTPPGIIVRSIDLRA